MFVDSDDALEDGAVEALMREYSKGGCEFVTATYRTMSEDGRSMRPKPVRARSHGAPWGRVYGREVWRDVCFPEGLWFEDTVQAYCVGPRFASRYLDVGVYRYRRRASSVTATCSASKRGADAYWVVEAMIGWCRRLGIELGQALYDQTVRQFGALALNRTAALDEAELRAFFACCCGLLEDVGEFRDLCTTMRGAWRDIDRSLRTQDFGLWKLACSAL